MALLLLQNSNVFFSSTRATVTSPKQQQETTPTLSPIQFPSLEDFTAIAWSFRHLGASLLLLWFAGFCIVASFFFVVDLCILTSAFCQYALPLLVSGGISGALLLHFFFFFWWLSEYKNRALETQFQFKRIKSIRLNFHAYIDKFPHYRTMLKSSSLYLIQHSKIESKRCQFHKQFGNENN